MATSDVMELERFTSQDVKQLTHKVKTLGVLKKTEQLRLLATLEDCFEKLATHEKVGQEHGQEN